MAEITEKYRVQLDFSKEALEELDTLQRKLHAASRAEVVRNALGVLKWVTNNLAEENKIVVEKKTGEHAKVDFPFLLIK
jgi:metal-responsive CopG/Arc/MetJ family transcriptional regulator